MKRSGIKRRTPLQRKPFRPVVRLNLPKAREARKLYAELRHLLCERARGCCERCGTPAPLRVGECHHRLLRSRGGVDDAWTCVWLCASCHEWAHREVATATARGWIVPSWASPREWRVLASRHGKTTYWMPTPTGWQEATPHPSQIEQQETA